MRAKKEVTVTFKKVLSVLGFLITVAVLAGIFYGINLMKQGVDARNARPKPAAKVVVVDSTGKAVEQPSTAK